MIATSSPLLSFLIAARRYAAIAPLLTSLTLAVCAHGAVPGADSFTQVLAVAAVQTGAVPAGVTATGRLILANEPDGGAAGAVLDFDLETVAQSVTPLARIQLGEFEKLKVSRPGHSPGVERGALHVWVPATDGSAAELAGSLPIKPGGNLNAYAPDVTAAVNEALARPKGKRKIRMEVRLTGKPLYYEVYALSAAMPVLEIGPTAGWKDDWEQRLEPIARGSVVYHESCFPLAASRNQEIPLRLLYPAKRILSVVSNGTGETLEEGRDWILRDGQFVLPVGTRAPLQIESEFYQAPHKDKEGRVTMVHSAIHLVDGPWFHQRQVEVTYEPAARNGLFPPALSTLDQLPRTKERLLAKHPLTVILFGDSISAGYNSSKLDGVWPYQASYGELVARRLEQVYGSRITFMNHARAGDTAAHAVTQVDAQVAWFKPDLVLLAYGMNDRAPQRRGAERENLEKIIDAVRVRSPDTEFVVITPMLNNPKQPTGLDPVKFIRDEELQIGRPRLAFVDMTSTELAMLERKNYLDLSGNGANHPNDFLHRLYAQRILEVLAPARAAAPLRIVCSAYTFHKYTVFEAIDKAEQCGAHFIETFTNQALSPDDSTKIYALSDAQRARLMVHLARHHVAIASCMGAVPKDEAKARAFFDIATKLGAENIGTDSVDSIDTIEKIIGDYHLTVAFHNHPASPDKPGYRNSDPVFMRDLLQGRDSRIGICADTGHYAASNVVPLDAIKLLAGRIKSVHLKERSAIGRRTPDQVYGTGVCRIPEILAELRRQRFSGPMVIEYEANPADNLAEVKQCASYLQQHGAETQD